MKLRIKDKQKAIELRCKGRTYSEIIGIIPNLSKGTLSGWLKNIELTKEQRYLIACRAKNNIAKNQLKGAWANKIKAQNRINIIQKKALVEFNILSKNSLFIAGIMLYWAEGGKKARSFQFVNSDWRIIQLMLRFLREIAKIDEELIKIRLYIHEIYKDENCEKFWLEITQISPQFLQKTIYKPSLHKVKKNKNYKGCCRIEITQSEIYWKIIKWQELLFEQI